MTAATPWAGFRPRLVVAGVAAATIGSALLPMSQAAAAPPTSPPPPPYMDFEDIRVLASPIPSSLIISAIDSSVRSGKHCEVTIRNGGSTTVVVVGGNGQARVSINGTTYSIRCTGSKPTVRIIRTR
jgi:hypothetical protein